MLINEGRGDRIVRVVAGVAILMFVPRTAWAWLGLVPLVTGVVGYCALYHLLGWSTNRATRNRLA